MKTTYATTVFLLGVAACGGGELDPGAGNDPGTGTGTLAIEGSVRASPRGDLANARTSAEFETEFSLRVSLNTQTVTTGTVTITSSSGQVPLTFDGGNNRWTGQVSRYDEVYVLDIESGSDTVSGVRVDGPDIHVFSEPSAGAMVDPTMPLTIRWSRDDQADSARIDVQNFDALSISDSGTYELAAGAFTPDTAEARTHRLRLTRTNSVVPAGTVAGSLWSVAIENEIEVVTPPQPAL